MKDIIDRLGLVPHPEGGYYREIFRSHVAVQHPLTGGGVSRAAMTSIYFLLEAGDRSAWHRVQSDEAWCLLDGGPLELHLLEPGGGHHVKRLARTLDTGEELQAVVPAGWWQAASPAPGARFALCACIVAPGFDFADFELARREELVRDYPDLSDVIGRF